MAQSITDQQNASRVNPFQLQSAPKPNVQAFNVPDHSPMFSSYSAPQTDSFSSPLIRMDSGYSYPYSGGSQYGEDTSFTSTYNFNDPYGQFTGPDPVYQPPLDNNTVIARIQSVSGDIDGLSDGAKDGKISAADLRKVVDSDDPKFDQGIKDAAKYLLENEGGLRGRLDGTDGQADGFFTTDSLNKLMVDPSYTYTPPQMTNTQALIKVHDELFNRVKNQISCPFLPADEIAGDATVNRQAIMALANDPNASQDVRDAAQHIIDNTALMEKLAKCDSGDTNNDFSINEFNRVINESDVDSVGVRSSSPYIY